MWTSISLLLSNFSFILYIYAGGEIFISIIFTTLKLWIYHQLTGIFGDSTAAAAPACIKLSNLLNAVKSPSS